MYSSDFGRVGVEINPSHVRLGRGLVLDEIAAQQRMRIRLSIGGGSGSEAAGNFGEQGWA